MRQVDLPPNPALDAGGEPLEPAGHPGERKPRLRKRLLRAFAIALLVVALIAAFSYVKALRAPGSAPASARTVEWIKDHGGAGLVVWVERVWYSHHQPSVGGTPNGGIPAAAGAEPSKQPPSGKLPDHLAPPAPLTPIASGSLRGEGVWQPVGRSVEGIPTVMVTYLRPDPVHTSLLAGVMWMDTKLLSAQLVAGTQSPGGGGWPFGAQVPPSSYPALAATFNSGFLLKDSMGGYYSNGRTAAPLVTGQASFVIYKNGSVNIGAWGTSVSMSADVASVRQNLWPLVEAGKPNSIIAADPNVTWGATFGGGILVWRSGVGITRDGALVYVDGPGLSIQSLADLLIHAGAIRAMELDINTVWTNGYFYSGDRKAPKGFDPHPLLTDQYRPTTRYLVPDERDFFMMTVRRGLIR